MKNTRQKIIDMYYDNHLRVKDISEELKVSSAYISKTIKVDSRYPEEKAYRKDMQKIKQRQYKAEFAKNKREVDRMEDNYLYVKKQHEQASKELSNGKKLTNESYRKWNYSAYKYNPSKSRYEFDEKLGRSYAVPKYIKER